MNRIWAPWRKAYIRPKRNKNKGCLFCRLLKSRKDSHHFILKRSCHSYAVLNLYPYNNGHVMIVPNRHVDSICKLRDAEKLDWLDLYEEIRDVLQKNLKPHGFNAGINIGRVGGAGIPRHLHMHIVPRWQGDVNFMPVVGGVKVISESLDSVYRILKRDLRRSKGRRSRK